MKKAGLSAAAVAAAVMLSGVALAQTTTATTVQMTPQQEQTIYTTVTGAQVAVQPPPPSWTPTVGVVVPQSVQLYAMPSTVTVPGVSTDTYTVINNRVVLVDPQTRHVLRIIER
jgi:hypothetical protein